MNYRCCFESQYLGRRGEWNKEYARFLSPVYEKDSEKGRKDKKRDSLACRQWCVRLANACCLLSGSWCASDGTRVRSVRLICHGPVARVVLDLPPPTNGRRRNAIVHRHEARRSSVARRPSPQVHCSRLRSNRQRGSRRCLCTGRSRYGAFSIQELRPQATFH